MIHRHTASDFIVQSKAFSMRHQIFHNVYFIKLTSTVRKSLIFPRRPQSIVKLHNGAIMLHVVL